MSAFLCGREHIGQLVAWGNAHGPDPVAGAEALARANLGSLAARYRLDIFPDWESRVAQKFGGYEDNEEYVRLRPRLRLRPKTFWNPLLSSRRRGRPRCPDLHVP